MFVGEFNSSQLGYILIGLCINSTKDLINSEMKSILKKEIITSKPEKLIHSYTIKEFKELLQKYKGEGFQVNLKEIIPNTYGIGLIREVGFENSTVEELLKTITKKFRYYAIIRTGDYSKSIIITYNPDLKSLEKVKIKMNKDAFVSCTTMQTGENLDKIKREFKFYSKKENNLGVLIVYDIDLEEV